MIEQAFNDKYNFEKTKKNSIELLEKLISNSHCNFLKDEEEKLPAGLKYSDLKIRYKCTNIFINNTDREFPYYRICLELVHPRTEIQLFYYDVDYNIQGDFSDEYFGKY
nr:hypothetical protein [Paenibacillus alba]